MGELDAMVDGCISAIKPLAKPRGRFAIHVGGRRVAVIDETRLDELGLQVGQLCDAARLSVLRRVEAEDGAMRDAIRMLGRRDFSTGMMAERLARREHGAGAIGYVVERLVGRGLIDDEAYGRALIEAELGRGAAGERRLIHKLVGRRLPRPLAERLAGEVIGARDVVSDARELAARRLATTAMRRCDAATRKRRIWGLLARRGFDSETIAAALDGLAGMDGDDAETWS